MKPDIALIGPGRVGCAISKRLYTAGYPITSVISRSRERAAEACSYIGCATTLASDRIEDASTAQIILLAVPDDQIQNSALKLQTTTHFSTPATLVHFSGLHPAEIMYHHSSPLSLLSLHPLLPFANREKAFLDLQQCPCALESNDPQTLLLGEKLVSVIGGQFFTLDHDKKVLYHTAACVASNYLVTLLASARDLLINCGIKSDQAIPLLLPLVHATLENVKHLGPEQGLTGPIVRGDLGTVTAHIQTLKNDAPELLQLYLEMGKLTTLISERSGRLDTEKVTSLNHLFSTEINSQIDMQETRRLSDYP